MNKVASKLLLILFFLFGAVNAQIKIKELPSNFNLENIPDYYFGKSETREILPLNDGWKVYISPNSNSSQSVSIPAFFEGRNQLIFEHELVISKKRLDNYKVYLNVHGINQSAEIVLNDFVIHKHVDSMIPFQLELPGDILSATETNKLIFKVNYELDSEETIPFKQRYLFPQSKGGIIRDVFLKFVPKTSIRNHKVSNKLEFDNSVRATTNFQVNLENLQSASKEFDEEGEPIENEFSLNVSILDSDGEEIESDAKEIEPTTYSAEFSLDINSPNLWSPKNPNIYYYEIEFFKNDSLIDKVRNSLLFNEISTQGSQVIVNNNPISLNGTAYYNYSKEENNSSSLKKFRTDLKIIKDLGFNTVRFAKAFPSPLALRLCEEYGLIALIEIPLNSAPTDFIDDEIFMNKSQMIFETFVDYYDKFQAVGAFGVGSGYLGDSKVHLRFADEITKISKERSSKLTYISALGMPEGNFEHIDLIGLEIYKNRLDGLNKYLENLEGKEFSKPTFISEATYPTFRGGSDGYNNPFSYEAQAKYFDNLIKFSEKSSLAGFIINSAFDFRGDYVSFSTRYNEKKIYKVGILGEDRSTSRISYKVIKSNLTNGDKVTIPIGSKKDEAPLFFVVAGLVISLIMGLLINSKRKFRQDASRALLRPYNFFADIRDSRLLSGFQANLLMLIISGSLSLLATSLLYFIKTNIFVEKLLLSFGSEGLLDIASYLAWNPIMSFVYIFVFFVLFCIVISLIIKAFTVFINTIVYFSGVYYTAIWAFLPLVLLLPVGIILYRILVLDIINIYIYIFFILYFLWLFSRLFQGIYVLFDVSKGKVYLYGLLFVIVVLGGTALIFQFTSDTISHAILAFEQNEIM
jgi:beta-galactosidase